MEILNAGAFVNLENQAKIECLKFTAVELAIAALETDGFSNEEEPARKLALEFWQGLDYMCRENERGTIQNIFVNQFLERLRELRRPITIASETVSAIPLPDIVPQTTQSHESSEDEFLGVISATEQEPTTLNENIEIQEFLTDQAETSVNHFDGPETIKPEEAEIVTFEPEVRETTAPEEDEIAEDESEELEESNESDQKGTEIEEISNNEKQTSATQNLSSSEKEPYQWGKCTVHAAIQLLPNLENAGTRQAVLSVKTHDFLPSFALIEIPATNPAAVLVAELEKIFAQYQADLPLKVIDKMKKEKSVRKRSLPRSVTETKTTLPSTAAAAVTSSADTNSPPAQTTIPIITPPAESAVQGSLF